MKGFEKKKKNGEIWKRSSATQTALACNGSRAVNFRIGELVACGSIPRPGQAGKVRAEAHCSVPFSLESQRSRDN